MAPVPGFTRKAIADWAATDLAPGCQVTSDGLACFAGVTDAGCEHTAIIVGGRKPKDLPQFSWVNTILGNLKTSFGGAYHAFDFAKYGTRYLGTFAYDRGECGDRVEGATSGDAAGEAASTAASTSTRFTPACSSPPRPWGHARSAGSAWLRNLANQDFGFLPPLPAISLESVRTPPRPEAPPLAQYGKMARRPRRDGAPAYDHASDHDLRQLDEAYLAGLTPEQARALLSGRWRISRPAGFAWHSRFPSNSSRPPSSRASPKSISIASNGGMRRKCVTVGHDNPVKGNP